MKEIIINEQNFVSEVINSDKPVLLDFYATWCGPCKMLAPIIEEIANEYSDRVKVCKLDVDEVPSIAQKYGIQSIPTVMYIKDGQIVETALGFRPKDYYVGLIG